MRWSSAWIVAMCVVVAEATSIPAEPREVTRYGAAQITEISYEQLDAADATEGETAGSGDWIEIYNPSETDKVDLTGWAFTDRSARAIEKNPEVAVGHWFELPELELAPKSFAVLARDEMAFRTAYRDRDNALDALVRGSFKFGLTAKGETVRLLDASNETVYELTYDDKSPWPNTSEGGYSLELIDVRLDPNDPFSWISSYEEGGTPGEINSIAVSWG